MTLSSGCKLALNVLLLYGVCETSLAQNPVHIELTESDLVPAKSNDDLVLAMGEDCGRAAFRVAGPEACDRPTFESMMPIALLWVNCYRTALKIEPISCGKPRNGKLLRNREVLAKCRNELPDRQFATLFQFTMLAMKSCKVLARRRADEKIKNLVASMVERSRSHAVYSVQEAQEYSRAVQSVTKLLQERRQGDFHDVLKQQEEVIRQTAALQNTFHRMSKEFRTRVERASAEVKAFEPKMQGKMAELASAIHSMENNTQALFRRLKSDREEAKAQAKWERWQFAFMISYVFIFVLSMRGARFLLEDAWALWLYLGSIVTVLSVCLWFPEPIDDFYRERVRSNNLFSFRLPFVFNYVCLSSLGLSLLFWTLDFILDFGMELRYEERGHEGHSVDPQSMAWGGAASLEVLQVGRRRNRWQRMRDYEATDTQDETDEDDSDYVPVREYDDGSRDENVSSSSYTDSSSSSDISIHED